MTRKILIEQIEWVTNEFEWPEVMKKEWICILKNHKVEKLKDLKKLKTKELNNIYGEAYSLLT